MNNLYIVVLVAECNVSAPDHSPAYQECFTLIKAASHDEAQQKAHTHAHETIPVDYPNIYGETVTWTIKKIGEVQSVLDDFDNLESPIDLFVRSFDDYELYHRLFESRDESTIANDAV